MNALIRPFLYTLILLLGSSQNTVHAEPSPELFLLMKGKWQGQGTRIQTVSGKVVQVSVTSEAQIQGNRLYSANQFTEVVQTEGKTKSYTRNYWLESTDSNQETYSLITVHNGVEKVSSQGKWNGQLLTVDQMIAWGSSMIHVHSESRFETNSQGERICHYVDETTLDDKTTSRSEILYKLISP